MSDPFQMFPVLDAATETSERGLILRLGDKFQFDPDGCWSWTATRCSLGYGRVWHQQRVQQAHRVMYELLVGPIPEGLTLDHLCRNRACVNPDHLEPVSHRENVLRGASLVAEKAKRTHCIRGHEFTPENTRVRGNTRNCRACARDAARLAMRLKRARRGNTEATQ